MPRKARLLVPECPMAAAVIGGTVAEIGGGKFANGAVTGAFIFMFNEWLHGQQDKRRVVVYEIRKGVVQVWSANAAVSESCTKEIGCNAPFKETIRFQRTAEVPIDATLDFKNINSTVINGPVTNRWFYMEWHQETHAFYNYRCSGSPCEYTNPRWEQPIKTEFHPTTDEKW